MKACYLSDLDLRALAAWAEALVSDLAKQYGSKAAFVHLEVWRDRQANAINRAAAEWVYRDGDLTEPWIFLMGPDGKVVARWDNVATRGEIEPALQSLS